jgi:alginate O-acetyltransferase complex protein AlgI
MGGNRRGAWRTWRNLILAMLLGGLWHGASWKFVIWGGYHGMLLAFERAPRGAPAPRWWRAVYPLRAFGVFVLGRSVGSSSVPRTSKTACWISAASSTGRLEPGCGICQSDLELVILALAIAEQRWEWLERLVQAPAWAYAGGVALLLLTVELLGVTDITVPFVYF